MEKFSLRKASLSDGIAFYEMLQRIGKNENEFKNTANGLSLLEFSDWLAAQVNWSNGKNLPKGYVPQTVFWLLVNDFPVGIGKIRHRLNDNSRTKGGNIGYAIDPIHRGKGYATVLLGELIKQAKKMNIGELLLTVEKNNPASKRVIEKCGGRLLRENKYRWFFTF